MKSPNVHLSVQWDPRRESVEHCADKVLSYYRDLGQVSTYFRNWRLTTKSKPSVDVGNAATMRGLLLSGQNRRDIGGESIPELGYAVTLWNGERALTVQSRVQCGLFSSVGGLKNQCSLVLSYPLARQLGAAVLLDAFKCMIGTWNPDAGSAYVYSDRDGHEDLDGELETLTLLEFVRHSNGASTAGAEEVTRTTGGMIYRRESAVREVLG
ncbi:MAG: Imm52 family immunity protein [Gammaproteobacteria bacterium]